MGNEIAERLRHASARLSKWGDPAWNTCFEAAAEIDRLEGELRLAAELLQDYRIALLRISQEGDERSARIAACTLDGGVKINDASPNPEESEMGMIFTTTATTTDDEIDDNIPFADMRAEARRERDELIELESPDSGYELHELGGAVVLWHPVFLCALVNKYPRERGVSRWVKAGEAPSIWHAIARGHDEPLKAGAAIRAALTQPGGE